MSPARQLAYITSALPTATGQRRADLEAKAAHLRGVLAGKCSECGRAAEHLTGGKGSTCARKHAS